LGYTGIYSCLPFLPPLENLSAAPLILEFFRMGQRETIPPPPRHHPREAIKGVFVPSHHDFSQVPPLSEVADLLLGGGLFFFPPGFPIQGASRFIFRPWCLFTPPSPSHFFLSGFFPLEIHDCRPGLAREASVRRLHTVSSRVSGRTHLTRLFSSILF